MNNELCNVRLCHASCPVIRLHSHTKFHPSSLSSRHITGPGGDIEENRWDRDGERDTAKRLVYRDSLTESDP